MSTTKTPTQFRAVKGWRDDPSRNRLQLTHAVVGADSAVAACGVLVTALGGPWTHPDQPTVTAQCPTCAKAVQLIETGEHRR